PNLPLLSQYQVKWCIRKITGVNSIKNDMCINTCLAYTGPYSELDICPKCGEPRYDQNKFQARLQIQALWRDEKSATSMKYRGIHTQQIIEKLAQNNGEMPYYNDLFTGTDNLQAVADGKIQNKDTVLMLSLDGAQLYKSKLFNCCIYIWVILNHSPDLRYEKKYVLPGAFIPGPKKPKIVDLFLFPGMHHFAVLQKDGLDVW
ncbi:hypothetical protein SERLA73DRAFT_12791, partial [Serpula lacrymans var. lacrymans S7.3]